MNDSTSLKMLDFMLEEIDDDSAEAISGGFKPILVPVVPVPVLLPLIGLAIQLDFSLKFPKDPSKKPMGKKKRHYH